jgi:NADPH-dependent 2,4-dienoyl-CoA reductase/sulfur reductase-like enzyme
MCLGMSECHAIGARRVPLTCAVNAEAAREEEMVLVPTERPKEVAVIGAGPAGLETARVAALRGHHVYLCDRERTLGGTIRFLALDPSRRNLQDHAVYFETQLRNLDVEMLLGNEATADELAEFGLDAVVVATGGRPLIPDVPGIRDANVVTALDALRHPDRVGGRAVVVAGVDGNLGAPTVAAFLARAGRRVELVSEHFDFAHRVEDGTRLPLLHQLRNLDLPVSLVTKLVSVQGGGATLLDTFTREPRDLDDVTVVLACGLVADDTLARTLEGRVPEIHVIGDALAPRRMMHATVEGARVGRAL